MSENIPNIVFEVLNSKMTKSLISEDLLAFLPQSSNKVFSWHFLKYVNLFEPGNERTIVQYKKYLISGCKNLKLRATTVLAAFFLFNFSMHFQLYLCILIFQRQMRV
jgi:hypothetical protein